MLTFFYSLFSGFQTPPAHSFEDEAIIRKVIHQGRMWRVHYNGTDWTARARKVVTLYPGDVVYVVDIQNITLIIEPPQVKDPARLAANLRRK